MEIRRAKITDIAGINKLLRQVLTVHHNGRPDLFKPNSVKYTNEELAEIVSDNNRPIFTAVENDEVLGYAFCVMQSFENNNIMTDIKTLYIDDLCVDENQRGQNIGKKLYEFVLDYARSKGCYNVTLNVWACNKGAMKFYEKCGLTSQKIGMEKIL